MDNPIVTGMRKTLAHRSVKIPISRTVQLSDLVELLDIPNDFWAHEPSKTRSRAADVWITQGLPTIQELIQTRKSLGMNQSMRITVFRTGMEKLLIRFNQFTENVKVEFREHLIRGFNPSYTYYLDFILLSLVPDSIRYAPRFVAEIPEPAARAELVENSNSDFVVVSAIVEETARQHQTPSILRPGNFFANNTRETHPNHSEDTPVAVAISIDSTHATGYACGDAPAYAYGDI
jgi:hypothetical protein